MRESESSDGPGSVVCPGCGRLIGRDESSCFHCGRRRTALDRAAWLGRLYGGSRSFSSWASAAFVAVFATLGAVTLLQGGMPSGGGLLSHFPSPAVHAQFGSLRLSAVREGEWYRLITYAFLHGGILHLLFNAWVLSSLGPLVEAMYGRAKFLVAFLVFAVVAGAASLWWQDQRGGGSTVGASGVVFGMLGWLFLACMRRQDAEGRAVFQRVSFLLFINVLIALTPVGARIDHFAHGGGFFAGCMAALVVPPLAARGRETPWMRLTGLAATLLIVCALLRGAVGLTGDSGPGASVEIAQQLGRYRSNLEAIASTADRDPADQDRIARIMEDFASYFTREKSSSGLDREERAWLEEFVRRQRALHRAMAASTGDGSIREQARALSDYVGRGPFGD